MRIHSWAQTDLSEARLPASDDVPRRLGLLELSEETLFPSRIGRFVKKDPLASTKTRIRVRGTGDHDFLH